jgi:serine/threonine-protein kinase RsbW
VQDAGRDDIELILPASTSVIRLARLLASGVAAQASLDVDAVDDVRIGVDEVCSLLLEVTGGDRMQLRFDPRGDSLEVWGCVPRAADAAIDPERFGLSRQILDAVVDEHRVELDDEVVTFWIRKARRVVT